MTATPAQASGESSTTDGKSASAAARNAGRLAAVQALYQIEATDAAPTDVIKDFLAGHTGGILMTEDPDTAQESTVRAPELDAETFITIVRTVENRGGDVDGLIRGALSSDWPWERMEMIVKAILRAGVAELLSRADVPAKAIVSEFIDIAHAFYAGPEPRMVNAVLDKIARAIGRLEPHNKS